MKRPLFEVIAAQAARYYGSHSRIDISEDAHEQIERLVKQFMPSGAGIDAGTEFDFESSNAEKLVFRTAYHHMDCESGQYDGWTDHKVTVRPSLVYGFEMKISGRNRKNIIDYLYDVFGPALKQRVEDGTSLVAREDDAIAHLRAVMVSMDDGGYVAARHAARVFLKRLDGDFSE